jgi:hypothetical protein
MRERRVLINRVRPRVSSSRSWRRAPNIDASFGGQRRWRAFRRGSGRVHAGRVLPDCACSEWCTFAFEGHQSALSVIAVEFLRRALAMPNAPHAHPAQRAVYVRRRRRDRRRPAGRSSRPADAPDRGSRGRSHRLRCRAKPRQVRPGRRPDLPR